MGISYSLKCFKFLHKCSDFLMLIFQIDLVTWGWIRAAFSIIL